MSENAVRPKRRKIALACEPCRERKARCDGGRPICSTCQRRSLKREQCVYKGLDDNERGLRERIRQLEQACEENGIDTETLRKSAWHPGASRQRSVVGTQVSPVGFSAHLDSPAYQNEPNAMNPTPSATSCASGVTAMGTLADDSGLTNLAEISHDFYGGSSVASFLHETCHNMSLRPGQRVSAKQATHPDHRQPSQFRFANVANFQLPPRSLADHLIGCYFERVYYLYPFFDRTAFDYAYNCLWQPSNTASVTPDRFRDLGIGSPLIGDSNTVVFHAALNAIFALGCPFSNLPASEKVSSAEVFFSRSKSHFGFDLLEMHNLGVVQVLLLVAQALQGTSFPNRCWNAVGGAYRIALALGLHTDSPYSEGESHDKEIRRRTWHGCITLDMLVSMTFGRPNITSGLPSAQIKETTTIDIATMNQKEKLKVAFLAPCARLSLVLNQLLSQLYPSLPRPNGNNGRSSSPTSIGRDIIADIEKQLDSFEDSLPAPLSWKVSESGGGNVNQKDRLFVLQRNVLQARFIYARLLLYRQLFTRSLANAAKDTTASVQTSPIHQSLDIVLQHSFELECAKRCILTAKDLIQLIHSTYNTKETGAWWWNGLYACTSGLILILSKNCPQIQSTLNSQEFGTSWSQCCEILENLGEMSASARASLQLLRRVHSYVKSQTKDDAQNSYEASRGDADNSEVGARDGADNTQVYDLNLYDVPSWDGIDTTGPFFYSWDIFGGYQLADAEGEAT